MLRYINKQRITVIFPLAGGRLPQGSLAFRRSAKRENLSARVVEFSWQCINVFHNILIAIPKVGMRMIILEHADYNLSYTKFREK